MPEADLSDVVGPHSLICRSLKSGRIIGARAPIVDGDVQELERAEPFRRDGARRRSGICGEHHPNIDELEARSSAIVRALGVDEAPIACRRFIRVKAAPPDLKMAREGVS